MATVMTSRSSMQSLSVQSPSMQSPSMQSPSGALDRGTAFDYVAAAALTPSKTGPVGLELEAHLVDLVRPTERVGWQRIQDLIAALPPLPGNSAVTVEPGGAIELSGPPLPDVAAAVTALRADREVLRLVLAQTGLGMAALGTDPVRSPRRVNPGSRYAAMEQHFAALGCGAPGSAMMTSTAALQVNLEAGPESGWQERVALAHRLGPVLVAVSACSPLLAGEETGWRSSRQRVWAHLDQARCGPLLGSGDPARDWAGYALAAPVMLVHDEGSDVARPICDRVSLGSWLDGSYDLGHRPSTSEVDYHLTTLFPPVRLRGFLEIRYLDAAPEPWWPALAAITAILMDDPVAAAAAAQATEATALVEDVWNRAARLGLADQPLHRAARLCLAAALDRCPEPLRAEVSALAELVERAECPGDRVLRTARSAGPAAALLAATTEANRWRSTR